MNKLIIISFIFLFGFSSLYAQDTLNSVINLTNKDSVCFSQDQVESIARGIKELQNNNKFDSLEIIQLKRKINFMNDIAERDSLTMQTRREIISTLEKENQLYQKRVDVLEHPPFYDTNLAWAGYGVGVIILSSWVLSNIVR